MYCCFGCRFAAAATRSRGEEGAASYALVRLGLAIFLSMNVMVFTMALWSQDLYGDSAAADHSVSVLRDLFRYLCMLFSLPVLFLLGGPLLSNAWESLRRGIWNTDLLLVVGVGASYIYSAASVFRDSGPVYFEVGCVVLVLVTLGRWLEARGKLRTTAAMEALHKLLPDKARRLENAGEVEVLLAEVRIGDHLRILPGERVPCDGRVLRHAVSVDEQVLTGESQPVVKEVGERVLGGSLNVESEGFVEVTATAQGGTLARLIELVQQAREQKGHYERLADRVSAWFLPAILIIAGCAFVWHTYTLGLEHGILTSLAVLLIACPCALGLATPMAVWAALGRAAQAGILFRNGEALERLARIRAVRFDKTGTLTTGIPTVATFAAVSEERAGGILYRADRLAAASTHSYSQAIHRFALARVNGYRSQELDGLAIRPPPDEVEIRTLPGRGVIASSQSETETLLLGSPRLMAEKGLAWSDRLTAALHQAEQKGLSLTCFGSDKVVEGVFIFEEQLRPETAETITSLRGLGLNVAVLTGDGAARGRTLGEMLGVEVAAELLPENKVQQITDARRQFGMVAMVGDGINDAPALAASDVGIALGCGTDVARESATVCLLGNDLLHVPWAIELCRQTVRVIRRNLFWAFAYNIVGIGFAVTGRLNPIVAALAMVLSSLLVVTNSLKLGKRAI